MASAWRFEHLAVGKDGRIAVNHAGEFEVKATEGLAEMRAVEEKLAK